MTREATLDEANIVNDKYHLLADTAVVIANPLVRNMATISDGDWKSASGAGIGHAGEGDELSGNGR